MIKKELSEPVKNTDYSIPDFELHNLYNQPAKKVLEYLGVAEKLEKYSIDTSCEMAYYQIYHYYKKGLTITASKQSNKPSSMDDVGRATVNRLRRSAYIVESIKFDFPNYKIALFKNVKLGMNKDIVIENIKKQLEEIPNWTDYFWLDKKKRIGIVFKFETIILKSAEIREIYSSMLE